MTERTVRVTVSGAYRSGSEVLLHDSGPLHDIAAVIAALCAAEASVTNREATVFGGEAEIVVRVAERQFQRDDQPPQPQAKPSPGYGTAPLHDGEPMPRRKRAVGGTRF